ncbi:hypothetical protein Tco_0644376, partial [Tanacetum coccineum]
AYVQQLESSRIYLTHLERELKILEILTTVAIDGCVFRLRETYFWVNSAVEERVHGLQIIILKTNTLYPSRKIRRIRGCTHQRLQRNKAQYAVSREDQYAVLEIWNEYNILKDIKRGPYSKKSPIRHIQSLDTPMTKVIKGEFEKINDVKVEDVSLTCDTPIKIFNNKVSRLSGMDDDLFTYEVEVANIPCHSNMDDDSEHEADDDMGYDSSDVAFTEWLGSKFFNTRTMDHIYYGKHYGFTGSKDMMKLSSQMKKSSDDKDEVAEGLEVGSIRRIQGIGYGVLEFLGVGTTFDIFQNLHILYLQYGVLSFSGYNVLSLFPLWSLVSAGTDTPYLP